MHKIYKEHYLYTKKPEEVNIVRLTENSRDIDYRDNSGRYGHIDCGDHETAQKVFKDIETKLMDSGKFINIDGPQRAVINLENLETIACKKSYLNNVYKVELLFTDGNRGGLLFLDDEQAANHCCQLLNMYKQQFDAGLEK